MLNGIEFTNGRQLEVRRIIDAYRGEVEYVALDGTRTVISLAYVLFIRRNGGMIWRRSENVTYTPDGFVLTRY